MLNQGLEYFMNRDDFANTENYTDYVPTEEDERRIAVLIKADTNDWDLVGDPH